LVQYEEGVDIAEEATLTTVKVHKVGQTKTLILADCKALVPEARKSYIQWLNGVQLKGRKTRVGRIA
jgi:hypothetical protein